MCCVCVFEPIKLYNKQSSLGIKREAGAAVKEPQCDGVERALLRRAEQKETERERERENTLCSYGFGRRLKYLGFIFLSND